MPARKLTLSVDEDVIEKARRYSKAHGTSISRLVTSFLARLSQQRRRYTPTVQRLIGLLPRHADRAEYRRHLEEKYRR